MSVLSTTPYVPYNSLDLQLAEIVLKNSDFSTVSYKSGTTVLSFFDCRILDLRIENTEDINFTEVSLAFFNCFIGNVKVETITSKNVSIGFYGSVVSGRIESENLMACEFNNCLIPGSLFTIDVPKVTITYTKENLVISHWKTLFTKLKIPDAEPFQAAPIRYHIHGPKRLYCSSNFEGLQRDMFKPNLNIDYKEATDHVDTKIKGLSLESLSISGNPAGKVSVESTRIDNWFVYNFSPSGEVSFYHINPILSTSEDAKIGIHRCNLDNVWFDNVSFDRYPKISLFKTKFSKAIFTACDFPNSYSTFSSYFLPNENVHNTAKRPPNFAKAQYEIFLQLKKAMEDTGNFYEAQKLQAISHDALKQIAGIPRWDRLILCVNSRSNNHGLSIKRAFFGFFIFSIPVYILYLLAIGRIFNSNEFDANLIGYYFSFIDLTHRNDFLFKEHPIPGWALFIDYLGKLIVGFFIYQFIAAFRKYGKK